MQTMWVFKTKNFTIQWDIEEDCLDTSHMDSTMAKKCRKHVESGYWQCFSSTISVIDNATGIAIGEGHLGQSIYRNPKHFRDHFGMNGKGHGSYFSQMVREAVAQARKNFALHQERLKAQAMALQSTMSVRLRNTTPVTQQA